MRFSRLGALVACVSLARCGDDKPPPPPVHSTSDAPAAPHADDILDQVSEDLRKQLPRELTAQDVDNVLALDPIVEDEGEDAAADEFARRGANPKEWGSVRARVSLAHGWLMISGSGNAQPPRASLKADVDVVRPFRKRLEDTMEAQRKTIDRSGHMVSIGRPLIVGIRRENPWKWTAFVEPVTGRKGFQVNADAGEQLLIVRFMPGNPIVPSNPETGRATRRYAFQPGGTYVEDDDQIVVRPTGGSGK